jgi:hypothetical protein
MRSSVRGSITNKRKKEIWGDEKIVIHLTFSEQQIACN